MIYSLTVLPDNWWHHLVTPLVVLHVHPSTFSYLSIQYLLSRYIPFFRSRDCTNYLFPLCFSWSFLLTLLPGDLCQKTASPRTIHGCLQQENTPTHCLQQEFKTDRYSPFCHTFDFTSISVNPPRSLLLHYLRLPFFHFSASTQRILSPNREGNPVSVTILFPPQHCQSIAKSRAPSCTWGKFHSIYSEISFHFTSS